MIFSSTRLGFFNLWRVGAEGGAPEWLPVTGGESLIAPSTSARSGRLVYEQWSYEADLWSQSLDDPDGPARPLFPSSRWDSHPRFSPTGERIAFTSRRSGTLAIWLGGANASAPALWVATGDSFASTLHWSPDGQRLVFSNRRNGEVDLYVAEGSEVAQRLTRGPAIETNPTWSNDGRWITFASDRSGRWQIWQMPASGGEPSQLTQEGGIYALESIHGERLYFSRHDVPGIWARSPDGTKEELVVDDLSPRDWGNWLVAEEGIYFVRRQDREATLALWREQDRRIETVLRFEHPPANPSLSLSSQRREVLYAWLSRNESDLMWMQLPAASD
ncbi:MAG: hypothetical protein MPN21_20255 [Thermoanaerobaculia bacterium]|nr:hypothetical protein [Thermoanaerobaculia bacterium]